MSVEEVDALHREARRLGYQICLDQQWKGHMHQLSYVTAERDALAKRCAQLSTRVDQLTDEGERMGRAFDTATELREFVEDTLSDRNAELEEELAQTQAMNTDLQRAEQEYESLIEKATRDVFRILDHLGVKFDSSIALRTALDALKHSVAGYDSHARKYSKLLELVLLPKQSGACKRGHCYSRSDEFAIVEEAERHVDWDALELRDQRPQPVGNLEEVPL